MGSKLEDFTEDVICTEEDLIKFISFISTEDKLYFFRGQSNFLEAKKFVIRVI